MRSSAIPWSLKTSLLEMNCEAGRAWGPNLVFPQTCLGTKSCISPNVLKVIFTYWWLINKVEHSSDGGSLEVAQVPEVFGG